MIDKFFKLPASSTCVFLQGNLMKRINVLRPLAETCSNREVAILAVAIEELYQEKGVDAMTDLLIIQVEETLVVDFCFFLSMRMMASIGLFCIFALGSQNQLADLIAT